MKKFCIIISVILLVIIIIFLVIRYVLFSLNIYVKNSPKNYTQQDNNYNINNSKYSDFITEFEKFSSIPGLKEGGVPQGLCYSKKYNVLFLSEYHFGGAPSVLHIIDLNTKQFIKSIILNEVNGDLFLGHVGGVTTDEETLWITDDYALYEYSLEEIIKSEDMDHICAISKKNLNIKADFINYHKDILWIGEYYYYPIYRLDESKSKDRLNDKALLIGYNKEFEPEYAFYLPDKAQGIEWDSNDNLVISSSFWSFESSNIKIYSNPFDTYNQSAETIKINDKSIVVSHIDENSLIKDYVLPPMAEGIEIIDNELYVVFESASNFYRYYTNNKTDFIYKTKLENN